jgi:nitrogen fixation/metabolism regulation signal transduction histidine kinase
MGFERFGLLLTLRLGLVFGGLLALGYLGSRPGYHAATVLALLVTLGLAWEVHRFVSRTNRELSRFLDAVRYADFGQRFQFGAAGAGFERLGETFAELLERFRQERKDHELQVRHLKALLEHVPVPLVSLHADGSITVWNNSGRRLFGVTPVARVEDLAAFGDEFQLRVRHIQPGERVLADFVADGVVQRVTLAASELTIGTQIERLVSVLNIQSELDGMQLSAWQDLVRVLTHEIMNSITPVASLAKTAVDLVEDARERVSDEAVREELDDARDAVTTVARRSDGLMNFVSGYRQLTRPPTPEKSRFPIRGLFEDVERIVSQELPETITLTALVEPEALDLRADRQMIEQVLINLVLNARQALDGATGNIGLLARLNPRGHVVIAVRDDGPGVPEDIQDRIFVPFYTTRRDGSGVGLALSRQIMIAHGGAIACSNRETGGAEFALVF